jgi:hypothetical protein
MSTPTESPVPNCPTCGLPMFPDASETTTLGAVKTVFHCVACKSEMDRITPAIKPPISKLAQH